MREGIHIFIFCCAEYRNIVKQCMDSIDLYVEDHILSKNVVTNCKFDAREYNVILDRNFWDKLDPHKQNIDLFQSNWHRQQLFKLSVNQYVSGNVLILDAEVLFLRPIRFVENDCATVFINNYECNEQYSNLIRAVGVTPATRSAITDLMVFNTDVLSALQEQIRNKTNRQDWLKSISEIIFPLNNPTVNLSEFELYYSFLLEHFPEKIKETAVCNHVDLKHADRGMLTTNVLLDKLHTEYPNNTYISSFVDLRSYDGDQTKWLTQYDIMRDESWPDCDDKTQIDSLPSYIVDELTELWGPDRNTW